MNFDYSEEQQLLADSVQRFVAQDYAFEARRAILVSDAGMSPAAWKTMADIGLIGMALPAEHGGFGGGALDLMSVMEAFGAALVVEPFLSTLMGARFVARGGNAAQKALILPAVAEGRMTLAFAQVEEGARYDLNHVATRARKVEGGHVIDGDKRAVVHASSADRIVVSARTSGDVAAREGISLFLVDPKWADVSMQAYRSVDAMRSAHVSLAGVKVSAEAMIGAEGHGLELIEEVVDYATALVCAEAVGAIKYANDATLEYLKTRRQFGVPIGSFQALQHRMVDMVVSYEQAKSMASLACARVDAELPAAERKRVVSAAKIRISDACRHVSQESVQLHGGMGMSDELKVSHTFRRLTVIARQFGDADHHLERFAG